MSTENASSHEEATWRVQNRGVNDESDATVVRAGVSHEPIDMAKLEPIKSVPVGRVPHSVMIDD